MKKTLRVLLALALALCLTPAALAETVIDGQADPEYHAARGRPQ